MAVVTGCTGGPSQSAQATAAPPAVQIGPENVVKVESGIVIVGPLLSGELRPEREAAIRAEIGGSIVQVTVEEGETVRKGALLGRIETRTLDEARQSAVSALTSVENQLAVARRESERTEQLVTAGALAARDLDLAKSNVTGAEAQLADARSRLASADRQLSDTIVRSPMAGIVADRAVNAGDVVSPGTALFTVIDPSSMRFEASVPSENVSDLRVGAAVQFEVRGYQTAFTGRIQRIGPQADPITRQVPIFVAIPHVKGQLVAGLFAEGRVASASASGLIVPTNAVNTNGDMPWVLRVADGKAERVHVTLGLSDARTERVHVVSGLREGDNLLRGAAQGITPGTAIQIAGER